jgi:hypothetical protein
MSGNRRLTIYLTVFSMMVAAILLIGLRSCVTSSEDEITAYSFEGDSIVELKDG